MTKKEINQLNKLIIELKTFKQGAREFIKKFEKKHGVLPDDGRKREILGYQKGYIEGLETAYRRMKKLGLAEYEYMIKQGNK